MKHTAELLRHLIIALGEVPRNLNSKEDQVKAKWICKHLRSDISALRKLIEHHKTEEMLDRLEHSHIKIIEDWANSVENLFKKLDDLLIHLDEYADKLDHVRENEPEKWNDVVQDAVLGVYMSGLLGEEEELTEMHKIGILEEAELRQLLEDQRHIDELIG